MRNFVPPSLRMKSWQSSEMRWRFVVGASIAEYLSPPIPNDTWNDQDRRRVSIYLTPRSRRHFLSHSGILYCQLPHCLSWRGSFRWPCETFDSIVTSKREKSLCLLDGLLFGRDSFVVVRCPFSWGPAGQLMAPPRF